jgi:hypothetical protein
MKNKPQDPLGRIHTFWRLQRLRIAHKLQLENDRIEYPIREFKPNK